jgi:AhpD family alkylhydroperoxidase
MTEAEPRIVPLPRGTLPDEVRVALQGWLRSDATEVPTPLDTLARHPDLARSFLAFNRHLLFGSTLPPRTRELLVLRTAAICGCAFEREQHEVIARREGVDDATIARTADGPDVPGWPADDAALIRATDELLSTWTVSESTWQQLATALDDRQLMDVVFTVGAYALLAMAFNAFGLRSDPAHRSPAERWGEDVSSDPH